MSQTETTEITRLLAAMRAGDAQAGERIFPMVYDELRRVAGRILSGERADHTLNPTDLVHEAWLRLGMSPGNESPVPAADRSHFVGITIRAMRQVLIDHARARQSERRGGALLHVTLKHADVGADSAIADLLALDSALNRLEAQDARCSSVLHLTYFAGLDRHEIAEVLKVSVQVVDRELRFAKTWLNAHLGTSL